jgi:hypothetical protein
MFKHRRQRRRWAAQMLLVWLFGIVVGVANACVLPGPGVPVAGEARFLAASVSHHCDVVALDAGHTDRAVSGHDAGHPVSSAKTNCQDVCEKSTISIPPQKLGLDGSPDMPPLPGTFAVVLTWPHAPAARLGELSRHDAGTATAITIAYLRLAL